MNNKKETTQKKKNRKFKAVSLVLGVLIVVCVGILAIEFIVLRMDIKKGQEQLENTQEQIEQQQGENEELQYIMKEENFLEYIERIAREKLGYFKSGERVYRDSSAGE